MLKKFIAAVILIATSTVAIVYTEFTKHIIQKIDFFSIIFDIYHYIQDIVVSFFSYASAIPILIPIILGILAFLCIKKIMSYQVKHFLNSDDRLLEIYKKFTVNERVIFDLVVMFENKKKNINNDTLENIIQKNTKIVKIEFDQALYRLLTKQIIIYRDGRNFSFIQELYLTNKGRDIAIAVKKYKE